MKFREESEGGNSFVKLKGGESVFGVFKGDLYEYRSHWGANKTEVCSGKGCPLCAKGDKPGFRFRLNMIVKDKDTGQYVAKIFENGWKMYEQLRELNKEYPLPMTLVKITRQGDSKNDTSYAVIPAAQRLTGDQMKSVDQVALLPLEHGSEAVRSGAPTEDGVSNESVPF